MDAGKVAAGLISNIPIIGGPIAELIANKSQEKWFKKDLLNDLASMGFSPEQLKDLKKYLDTGKDQDLTLKMQELIAANPEIAEQLTEVISANAAKNNVPASSVNQDMLGSMPPAMSNFPEYLPHYMRSEGLAW